MGLRVMGVPLVACLVFSTLLITVTAEKTVKLSTTPIFPMIPQGHTNNDFQVLLRLEAPLAEDLNERLPIDLVIVLDVAGRQLLSPVKEAMMFVITQLQTDDSLTIVPPSGSQLVQELKTWRHSFNKKIEELKTSSYKASGLEEALKFLEKKSSSSSSHRAGFIVYVTDGEDGSIKFNAKLHRDILVKHPVHTIALGMAHDSRALQFIADESHGTYSFLDDDNLDVEGKKLTGALAVCLSGLKSVVAVGARVVLQAPEDTSVKIVGINSGGYNSDLTDVKTSGEVTFGALYSGEVKTFLVHLHVPAYTPLEGACDQQQLLTATFHQYSSSDSDDDHYTIVAPSIQAVLSVQRLHATDIAATATMLHKVPVPAVLNQIVRFSALETVKKELVRFDSMTVAERRGLGKKLQSQWEQFVQDHQFWSGLDLQDLDFEITTIVSKLTTSSSSSLAYLFSWLSSYQMQRPTAMGSPDNVAAVFVTVEMKLTLQMAVTVETWLQECPDSAPCEHCLKEAPQQLLVQSGGDVNTFKINEAYASSISVNDINSAINHIIVALMKANNLQLCDQSGTKNLLPS